jgi:hypothetical protein
MTGRLIAIGICVIVWLICHFYIKKLSPGDFGPQGGFIPFVIQVIVIIVFIILFIISIVKGIK